MPPYFLSCRGWTLIFWFNKRTAFINEAATRKRTESASAGYLFLN